MRSDRSQDMLQRCWHLVSSIASWVGQLCGKFRDTCACFALLMLSGLAALICVASSVSSLAVVMICFWPFVIIGVVVTVIVVASSRKSARCIVGSLFCVVVSFGLLFLGSLKAGEQTERRIEHRLTALSCALLSDRVSVSVLAVDDKSGFDFAGLRDGSPKISAVAIDSWLMGTSVELELMDGRRVRMQWSSTSTDRPVLESVSVARQE